MDNKEYGRGSKINIDEFINDNWYTISDAVAKEFKTEFLPFIGLKFLLENNAIDIKNISIKEFGENIDIDKMDFDEFYNKYLGYKEHSTSVTDFYNKMKKYGLWD